MAKPRKRPVEAYAVICGWREPDGRHDTHRSPQYAGPLEARGWAAAHCLEDHTGALEWTMDLMYYPPGRQGYAVDRWTPTGLGPPDPGRWHGVAVAASDAQTLAGQGAGLAQVAALRAVLEKAESRTPVQLDGKGGVRWEPDPPRRPGEVAMPRRLGEVLPEAIPEAPCGHPATAYNESGNPLCEREECRNARTPSGGTEDEQR